jgi:hypothetical protein
MHKHTYKYTLTHKHMCVCMYVCIYTCTYIYIYDDELFVVSASTYEYSIRRHTRPHAHTAYVGIRLTYCDDELFVVSA